MCPVFSATGAYMHSGSQNGLVFSIEMNWLWNYKLPRPVFCNYNHETKLNKKNLFYSRNMRPGCEHDICTIVQFVLKKNNFSLLFFISQLIRNHWPLMKSIIKVAQQTAPCIVVAWTVHYPVHWQKKYYRKRSHRSAPFRKSECSRTKDTLLFGKKSF